MRHVFLALSLMFVIFFSGCSEKELEFNKPALYWYEKIVESVGKGNMEKADDYFSSLQSEHIQSIFMPEAMLILADAHLQHDEYLLASYYYDEYLKRFGSFKDKEYIEYLKLTANYHAFKYPRRDQLLLKDSLEAVQTFMSSYPNSIYRPYVQTMRMRLLLAKELLDREIVVLYERMGEEDAASFYRVRMRKSSLRQDEVILPEQSFVRYVFEGDGGKSWLDGIVPRHKVDRGIDFMRDEKSWLNRLITFDFSDETTEGTISMNEKKEEESSWFSGWFDWFGSDEEKKDAPKTEEKSSGWFDGWFDWNLFGDDKETKQLNTKELK
jgi:outer membrane protein assembly factor BamD